MLFHLPAAEIQHPDSVQGLRFFQHHAEVLEEIDALDQHVALVRDEHFPVLGAGIGFGRGQDLEVLGVLVGADVEQPFAMIDVVAMLLFARQENVKFASWLIEAR